MLRDPSRSRADRARVAIFGLALLIALDPLAACDPSSTFARLPIPDWEAPPPGLVTAPIPIQPLNPFHEPVVAGVLAGALPAAG